MKQKRARAFYHAGMCERETETCGQPRQFAVRVMHADEACMIATSICRVPDLAIKKKE